MPQAWEYKATSKSLRKPVFQSKIYSAPERKFLETVYPQASLSPQVGF